VKDPNNRLFLAAEGLGLYAAGIGEADVPADGQDVQHEYVRLVEAYRDHGKASDQWER
jgi:hypothetical protein